MKTKSIFLFFLAMMIAVTFVACSSNSDETTNEVPNDNNTSNDDNQDGDVTSEEPEQVTIRFATAESSEVEMRRIALFQEKFPHIHVEIDEAITFPWEENLAAAAAGGTLPDVMRLDQVHPTYQHNWAQDLTPFLEADPDFDASKILGQFEAANYNGVQIAMPHSTLGFGMMINKDLFERENLAIPTADWTLEEARELARQLTRVNEGQFGFQLNGELLGYFPAQFDPSLGWAGYDGENFNFTNPAFMEAVNTLLDIRNNDRTDVHTLTQEEKEELYGNANPWLEGKIGMLVGWTGDFQYTKETTDFEWEFLPFPNAGGQRIPMVTYYAAISSTTEHPQEAFEFLKFLSYDKDAWLNRIEMEEPMLALPVLDDQDVWNKYMSQAHIPANFQDYINRMSNGFATPAFTSPGYSAAMAQTLNSEDGGKLWTGEIRIEDIAPVWQELAQKTYDEVMQEFTR